MNADNAISILTFRFIWVLSACICGFISMPRRIVIIGSINMDLVCRAAAIPRAGETILGSDFVTIPGGKGANQAVAAARLAGKRTRGHMIGRGGGGDLGGALMGGLHKKPVDTDHV